MRGAAKESKPVRIIDRQAYAEAAARLEKLKPKLEEARKRLEMLTARSGSVVQKIFSTSLRVVPMMTEAIFDDMARKIPSSGDIPEALMTRLRFDSPTPGLRDEYDLEAFNAVADATRTTQLLSRAVQVGERDLAAEKKRAIAEVLDAVKGERERIAREIAESVFDLATKLGEENTFVEGLRAQDASIPGLLCPPPFPIALRLNHDVIRWLAEVLGISESQVQSRMSASLEKALFGAVQ